MKAGPGSEGPTAAPALIHLEEQGSQQRVLLAGRGTWGSHFLHFPLPGKTWMTTVRMP